MNHAGNVPDMYAVPRPSPVNRKKKRAQNVKRPLPLRFGEMILLFLFISLLAGRFTLARVSDTAAGFDLRYVFVLVAALLAGIWWAGARQYLPKRVPMVGIVVFTMWCGWMVISANWAPREARTVETSTDFVFLFALIGLAWFVMVNLPSESLERVWTWLVVTGVVYFALAIASGPGDQGRYSAPGGGPNTFVRIMVVAAIAALYLAIVKRRTLVLWFIPLFAVGAALSGSRGGLVSAAIVMLLFIIPVVRRLGAAKTIGMMVLAGIGAVIASFWNNGYLVAFVQERFIEQTLIEGYSSGRDTIATDAWSMFLDQPILGVGLDGYYALQSGFWSLFEHPHNLVLATLAEAGVIGGLLLVTLLLRLTGTAAGRGVSTHTLFAIITGVYFFGTAMFSGDYYDSRFIWFFLGMAAISAVRGGKDAPLSPEGDSTIRAKRNSTRVGLRSRSVRPC